MFTWASELKEMDGTGRVCPEQTSGVLCELYVRTAQEFLAQMRTLVWLGGMAARESHRAQRDGRDGEQASVMGRLQLRASWGRR